MAWSDPKTFAEGEVLYASDLNKYYRDNMLLNEANVARTPGSYLTTDTTGSLTERTLSHQRIDNGEPAISTPYVPIGGGFYQTYTGPVDLGTPGPEVSCDVNTSCMIFFSAIVKSTSPDDWGSTEAIGIDIPTSSAHRLTESFTAPVTGQWQNFQQLKGSGPNYTGVMYVTDLTPGTHTFRMRYRLPRPAIGDAGLPEFDPVTATYSSRSLLVFPL